VVQKGDVLYFLWGTNWIYICYVEETASVVWRSQSSWLQIRRSGFDSRRYQIFWEVLDLERGPFSLVSTTEELLGRKSGGNGLEIWEYGRKDPSRWYRGALYPKKLALTSPTSGGRSVAIVRLRIQATEPKKLALSSPTSGGRSVAIVRLRIQATEFFIGRWDPLEEQYELCKERNCTAALFILYQTTDKTKECNNQLGGLPVRW
jgi:hypothetical protein